MFIHKKKQNIKNDKVLSFCDNNDINEIYHFFNELIIPKEIEYIVGMYMIFNKDINEDNDFIVKNALEKYLDYGFTNIMQVNNHTCLLIRFNVEYNNLCLETSELYEKLAEKDILLKCSIIYGDRNISANEMYSKLKEYMNIIKDTKTILISNYHEFNYKAKK